MVDNAPFLTHHHAGLTIEGYSRAAVQSYWRVPELKLGFDLGGETPFFCLDLICQFGVRSLRVRIDRSK